MSFYRDTIRTARKEHKCSLCGAVIHIGEKYHDKAGNDCNDDSILYVGKECFACQPLIDEFFASGSGDYGYNADNLYKWWRDVKCYDCKHHWPPCKPLPACQIPCSNLKNGRCIGGDTCDDMTHYCRCEKFEQEVQP